MRTELPTGVTQLVLPTPWLVGPVNAYILHGDPLTLVDTGPAMPEARAALVNGLAAQGLKPSNIELLVLTHQHPDHIGQAAWLVEQSGATVAAYHGLAGELDDVPAMWARIGEFTAALMTRHGMPVHECAQLEANNLRDQRYGGGSFRIDLGLADGQVLVAGGRRLTVHHRPGHSPSDIVLLDELDGLLVAGDHLLAKISSNPLSHPALGARDSVAASAEDRRARPLLDYISSLTSTRRLGARLVLPGHGPVFGEPGALIENRIRLHRTRADEIRQALAAGPRTARQLVEVLWDGLSDEVLWLGVAEVIAHLDLLLDEGRIRMETADGLTRSWAAQAERAVA